MGHSDSTLKLARELRIHWDSGDMYGSTMGVWFPLCNVVALRGDAVPASWNFNPGACGPSTEDDDGGLVETLEAYDTPTLIEFGDFLERIYERCQRNGTAY